MWFNRQMYREEESGRVVETKRRTAESKQSAKAMQPVEMEKEREKPETWEGDGR